MEFKENYFNSGKEFNKKRGLYSLKEKLPIKSILKEKSDKHYSFLLLEKWKLFKDKNKILDVGCGRGQFIKLNPYKKEAFGLELIDSEVKRAKKEGLNVVKGDANKKIPFPASSFDGIMCSHVLEHLSDPTKMFSEFKRVTRNGGIVVIAVPNFSFKSFFKDPTHKRPYPKEALYRVLSDHGFQDIKIVNGPFLNPALSAALLFFPKVRHAAEKVLGKIKPWEYLAIARVEK